MKFIHSVEGSRGTFPSAAGAPLGSLLAALRGLPRLPRPRPLTGSVPRLLAANGKLHPAAPGGGHSAAPSPTRDALSTPETYGAGFTVSARSVSGVGMEGGGAPAGSMRYRWVEVSA